MLGRERRGKGLMVGFFREGDEGETGEAFLRLK